MADYSVKHVVVDSGGFIKNAPLKDIAEKVYSIQDVVNEITDKATRQRLQVLPYDLKLREPSTEAIKLVTDFSKKTGDYRSLSAVDIKLMALVYQLEKELKGTDHIKKEPQTKSSWNTTKKHLEKPTEIAGFYLKKKGDGDASSVSSSRTTSVCEVDNVTDTLKTTTLESTAEEQISTSDSQLDTEPPEPTDTQNNLLPPNPAAEHTVEAVTDKGLLHSDGQTLPSNLISEDVDDSEEEEESESEDEEGWITPNNIQEVKRSMGGVDEERTAVEVGCLTLDFSMQNVLIQMGLNVISIDGMLIKRAKSYVQRCSACMKICTNMEKEFCPVCGNHTLQRIAMTVNDDGSIQYFMSRRKPVSLRGLRHSLPNPKGGKYHVNPLLCEDQPRPHQRMSKKAKIKYNVFEAGYIANNSPFAPTDTQSRSAMLGFGGGRKKRSNPNENKKVYGRRK